jgi:hypothetical protein
MLNRAPSVLVSRAIIDEMAASCVVWPDGARKRVGQDLARVT